MGAAVADVEEREQGYGSDGDSADHERAGVLARPNRRLEDVRDKGIVA